MLRVTVLIYSGGEDTTTTQTAIITLKPEFYASLKGQVINTVFFENPEDDNKKTLAEILQAWLCAIVSQTVDQQSEKPKWKTAQHDRYCKKINEAIDKYNIEIDEIVIVHGEVQIEDTGLIRSIVAVCPTF